MGSTSAELLLFTAFIGSPAPMMSFDAFPVGASSPRTMSVSPSVPTVRQAVGHTHTCPRCGDVFDHQKNPTHTCQMCGAQVWTQDPFPRPVTVGNAPSPVQYRLPPSVGTVGVAEGCVGGNCSVAQPSGRSRMRLFRR